MPVKYPDNSTVKSPLKQKDNMWSVLEGPCLILPRNEREWMFLLKLPLKGSNQLAPRRNRPSGMRKMGSQLPMQQVAFLSHPLRQNHANLRNNVRCVHRRKWHGYLLLPLRFPFSPVNFLLIVLNRHSSKIVLTPQTIPKISGGFHFISDNSHI